MNILIIKVGAIGDVIRTTSLLPGLKEKYPGADISWLTKRSAADLLMSNHHLEKVYVLESDQQAVLKEKYDLLINMDDDLLLCQLATKISADKRVGAYEENGKCLYTDDAAQWFDMGLISRFGKEKADQLKLFNRKSYQQIAYEMLGLIYRHQEPIIVLQKQQISFAEEFKTKHNISPQEKIIGVNTGANSRWMDKKMSEEKTTELINLLHKQQKHSRIILLGGAEERERNKSILAKVTAPVIDAGCDNSLMEFAALIAVCDVLVTSDSMALHLATAFKKRIVVFFCPTSPWEIELYGRGEKIIPKKGCVCCYKSICSIRPEYDMREIVQKTLAQIQ